MSSNNSRRLIRVALLLVLALAVCLVSGCSKKDEPAAAVITAAPEVTEATAEEAPAEVAQAEEAAAAETPAEEAHAEEAAAAEAPAEEAQAEEAAAAEAPAEEAQAEEAAAAEAPAEEAQAEEAAAAEAPAEEAQAEEAAAEPVLLVTVNGQEIKSDDEYLQNVISYYMDYAASYGYDTTDEGMLATINQYSLNYTIQTILIRQKAAELGLDQFTDEEKAEIEATLKAEWADTVDQYIAQYNPLPETATDEEKAAARADAEAALLTMGYDEARFVEEFSANEIDNRVTARLRDYLSEGKTVTEEDVQHYFDDLVKEDQENYGSDVGTYEFYTNYYGQSSYYVPEGYRGIVHILLPVDEELMNTWKDLSARLEEQQSAEEEEPTGEEEADEAEEGEDVIYVEPEEPAANEPAEAPAEEIPSGAEETPAPEAEITEEPTATPEPVTQEMIDAAEKAILESVQATVDEIKAKLADGASFDDLIKEYGTDPGMQNDETRAKGYSVHNDSIMYDPAFKDAAMALEKIGDVSDPVVGQYGVHILQYLRDVPAGAVELTEEMKEEFRNTLLDELKDEAMNTMIEQWMAEPGIVYTEEGEAWKIPAQDDEAEDEGEAEEAAEEEAPAEETAVAPLDGEITEADIHEAPAEEPAAEEAPADGAAAEDASAAAFSAEAAQPAEPEICTYTVYNTTGETVTELYVTDNATGEKSENYAGEGLAAGASVEIKGANKADYVVTLSFKTESGYEASFTTLHFEDTPISLLAPDAMTGATPISFSAPEAK